MAISFGFKDNMRHLDLHVQHNESKPLHSHGLVCGKLSTNQYYFFFCQVRGPVRSETVAFCMGLGRRAHLSAQQMESFCLSSASLSTLQTWCFLISFIITTGKSVGFWNWEIVLDTASSQDLNAFFSTFSVTLSDIISCYGPSKKQTNK